MAYIPVGFIHQAGLDESIEHAKATLGPEVAHVAYRIGEDDTGAPALFFRITMLDSAMTEAAIADSTGRVATTLFDQIRPIENWGLHPYFNFRSVSEQQRRPDPKWL